MKAYSETDEILASIQSIGLKELESVKLMDRIDTKYVVSAKRIPDILLQMNGDYKALEINNIKSLPYLTKYYDTCDYLFYNQHVTSRAERYKIRFRTYKTTETTFLEIKKHTRKNRTVKWRIESDLSRYDSFDTCAVDFLTSHMPDIPQFLKSSLSNSFRRVTLTCHDNNERITIDFDLKFSDENGKTIQLPWLSIIEHKRNKAIEGSKFAGILKQQMIHPVGFSKYCMGVSLLYENARRNKMKEKLILISKIENEYNRCNYE